MSPCPHIRCPGYPDSFACKYTSVGGIGTASLEDLFWQQRAHSVSSLLLSLLLFFSWFLQPRKPILGWTFLVYLVNKLWEGRPRLDINLVTFFRGTDGREWGKCIDRLKWRNGSWSQYRSLMHGLTSVADPGQNASGGTIVWAPQPLANTIYHTHILPLIEGV
jgi:hypothetical protein